jgi:hypothetical protein
VVDDVSIESRFSAFGDGYVLDRRSLFFHPRNSHGFSPRERIVSESYEIGPLEEEERSGGSQLVRLEDLFPGLVDSDEGSEEKPSSLWFGLPWNCDDQYTRQPTESSDSQTFRLSVPGPYSREVAQEAVLERPLVELSFAIIDEIRQRGSEKPPIDLSLDAVRIRQTSRESVNSESVPPPYHFVPAVEIPNTPNWVPSDKEEVWEVVRSVVLAPLVEKLNQEARIHTTYLPSLRSRSKYYYGPDDALTPLLEVYQRTDRKTRENVEEWLSTFEIGTELRVEDIAPGLYAPSIERNGGRRYLSDLGSGSAQLLPLILKLSTAGSSSIILLEEPEANLHPNLQARLADLLVELIRGGYQVLVETHSEYLVRRLQYLVATNACEPDQTSVLYVDAPERKENETPEVRSITIDDHGQLSEPFGSGFYDQASDLMIDLFKYGSEN